MRFNTIYTCDICDGPGIRIGLYTQGCNHCCDSCFNKETWNEDGGREWTKEINDNIIEMLKNDRYSGLSILGGEPFYHYQKDIGLEDYVINYKKTDMLLDLVKRFRETFGDSKTIWVWTGFTWEELYSGYDNNLDFTIKCSNIISRINVLIDGKFTKSCHERDLLYRGSTNQRIIDVQKSIKEQKIILYK